MTPSKDLEDILNLFYSFGLYYTVDQITRPCNNGTKGTCIDNIMTNVNNDNYVASVIPTIFSDHHAIFFKSFFVKSKSKNNSVSFRFFRPVNEFNMHCFYTLLRNINWFDLYKLHDINEKN